MIFRELENALSEAIMDLKPAPIPDEPIELEMVTLDRSETDNSKWLSYITAALDGAKTFEIHCWNKEAEWTELALQYGSLKDDDWRHGKIITGDVTPEFVQMLLGQPKPADTEIYNKMTPFFNVFLDGKFQSAIMGRNSTFEESLCTNAYAAAMRPCLFRQRKPLPIFARCAGGKTMCS